MAHSACLALPGARDLLAAGNKRNFIFFLSSCACVVCVKLALLQVLGVDVCTSVQVSL